MLRQNTHRHSTHKYLIDRSGPWRAQPVKHTRTCNKLRQ